MASSQSLSIRAHRSVRELVSLRSVGRGNSKEEGLGIGVCLRLNPELLAVEQKESKIIEFIGRFLTLT